jgi:uncharacterized membrane protein YjjB (DUF3815 family)
MFTSSLGALRLPVEALVAALATGGFAFLFGLGRLDLVLAAGGGALGWALNLALGPIADSPSFAVFVAAFAVGLWGEVASVVRKQPSTVYMIAGIIPLVPGGGMFYSMLATIEGNTWKTVELGLATMMTAFAIAAGMAAASAAARLASPLLRGRRLDVSEK